MEIKKEEAAKQNVGQQRHRFRMIDEKIIRDSLDKILNRESSEKPPRKNPMQMPYNS